MGGVKVLNVIKKSNFNSNLKFLRFILLFKDLNCRDKNFGFSTVNSSVHNFSEKFDVSESKFARVVFVTF